MDVFLYQIIDLSSSDSSMNESTSFLEESVKRPNVPELEEALEETEEDL